jgi:enoyl-CoA hydratase
MYENIEVEREDSVATITINRPRVLNALSHDTLQELGQAVQDVAGDESVRAVIITGSGTKAFAAGADIAELEALETGREDSNTRAIRTSSCSNCIS